jgi:hypothetical protein
VTTGLKGLVVAVATALAALAAVGLVLEALFEADGFGRDRDAEPRSGYLLLLAIGLVACVVLPVALWRALLPRTAPAWPLAFGLAVVGVLLILGFGFA